jgi:putative membrane protein insertion efficiency factor
MSELTTTEKVERRMVRAIAWYQSLRPGHPSPCRFFPTCSEYASEAITTHGPWRGLWLTVRRLSRCRPFGPSGFDPVPEIQESRRSSRTVLDAHDSTRESC